MSSISRSVYQKVCEENKRLWANLNVICTGDSFESIQKRQEYRKYFDRQKQFLDTLKDFALKLDFANQNTTKT